MLVKSIMAAPVVTVRSNDALADAIALLVYNKVSGLAVVDQRGDLCGILSEGDLLRRVELGTATQEGHWWSTLFSSDGLAEAYKKTNGRKVSEVMTQEPVTIEEGASLADAAGLMEKYKIKRLPVMHKGTLVGMLSRSDFVKLLGQFVAPAYEEQATSDGEIKTRILTEIALQKWSLGCRIAVSVHDGHVTLSGFVPSSEHQSAAKVAAENVVGVLSVDDNTALTEPVPIYVM